MSLTLVSIPIGHEKDITQRAKEVLESADLIIGEERGVAGPYLASIGLRGRPIELLNEHSEDDDINFLLEQCKTKKVALISDCGTPGFCDPGAELIKKCRQNQIPVTTAPGVSSLMILLSMSSQNLSQFVFWGFLPKDEVDRKKAYQDIRNESRACVVMETPYRLKKFLSEINDQMPDRQAMLALNLTQENETVIEGRINEIFKKCPFEKAEFLLLLYPTAKARSKK
jgi:16S rRNA (cytidine1402-2'-O)-methyltransferase